MQLFKMCVYCCSNVNTFLHQHKNYCNVKVTLYILIMYVNFMLIYAAYGTRYYLISCMYSFRHFFAGYEWKIFVWIYYIFIFTALARRSYKLQAKSLDSLYSFVSYFKNPFVTKIIPELTHHMPQPCSRFACL